MKKGVDNEVKEIAVEAYFKYTCTKKEESSLYKIERIWSDDFTEEYKIEDKPFTKTEFENYV